MAITNGHTRTIEHELQDIRKQGNGVITAEAVVEYAKDPATALHSRFNWDDTEAARLYRIHQARQVIRVHVYTPEQSDVTVRAFYSLEGERGQKGSGGGYRHIEDILSDPARYNMLLEQAIRDATVFQQKYMRLTELRPIMDAIAETKAGMKKRKKA